MRILINTPPLNLHGGVSNHYMGLKKYWTEQVKYNYIGSREKIPGWAMFPFDLIRFIFNIIIFSPHVIILNPSLGVKAIKRDHLFFRISRLLKKKTIIFIHGWDQAYANSINVNPKGVQKWFNKASCILVLSSDFKTQIEKWNVTAPIYLTSTKVDDEYFQNFDISQKDGVIKNILFLSRVEEEKGIFITLEVFKKLKINYPSLELTVAGKGGALEAAKQFVEDNKMDSVKFLGFIQSDVLINAFNKSQLYLFPTYHGEGMPTSVLEAMAFGLPVITRPVGGICDFFENEKMGYMLESKNPKDYYDAIEKLIEDKEKCKQVCIYNNLYATKNFMASKVAKRIEMYAKKVYEKSCHD